MCRGVWWVCVTCVCGVCMHVWIVLSVCVCMCVECVCMHVCWVCAFVCVWHVCVRTSVRAWCRFQKRAPFLTAWLSDHCLGSDPGLFPDSQPLFMSQSSWLNLKCFPADSFELCSRPFCFVEIGYVFEVVSDLPKFPNVHVVVWLLENKTTCQRQGYIGGEGSDPGRRQQDSKGHSILQRGRKTQNTNPGIHVF